MLSNNFEETLDSLLSEITRFLEDLKSSKLEKHEITKKSKLLEQILKVKEEYPQLNSLTHLNGSQELYEDLEGNNSNLRKGKSSPNISESLSFSDSNAIKGFLIRKSAGGSKLGFVTKLKDIIGKKYCTVENGMFSIFDNSLNKRPTTTFPLYGYEVKVPSGQNKEHVFELICPGRRSYQFGAGNKELFQKWITALKLESANNTGNSSHHSIPSFSDKNGDDNEDYEDSIMTSEVRTSSVIRASDPEDELYDDIATKDVPPKLPSQTKQRPPSSDESDEIYDDIADSNEPTPVPIHNIPKKVPPKPQKSITSKTMSPSNSVSNKDKTHIVSSKDGLPYDKMFYGKWDCSGIAKDELSFKYGDILTILSQEFDNFGWWVAELDGTVGLVPRDYLTPAYELITSK